MLEGITVLSETPVYNGGIICLSALAIIIGLSLAMGCFIEYIVEEKPYCLTLCLIGVAMLIGGIVIGTQHKPIDYHYKVTIDENVSMTEFFEKYEIVSQEGKIYTINEIE